MSGVRWWPTTLRTVRHAGAALAIAYLVVAGVGCGSGDDDGSPTASDLAPSQVAASTVPPPTAPGLCDPLRIGLAVVEPESESSVDQPDQLVELVNVSEDECEVDISRTERASPEMEPSVRLAPGAIGLVWIEAVETCDAPSADPLEEIVLDVNGVEQSVTLTFSPRCGAEVTAFFAE